MVLNYDELNDLEFALDDAIQNSIRYVRTHKLSKNELEGERRIQAICKKIKDFIQPLDCVMIEELPF